ncbi:dTDP-4-dehydrorhamnose 3,5-epimerase family protein [Parasphingopyxis sp.]|uniref:dTDP-4-dehydrorhamnose 3,5-epimerase family protein n=1 Tax=Parasphingopyxis sp. TaxID=1920299 RepID=UPI0026106023|nr:dTDP-4-dehydrorhamnose 3,5-epimerase family protein [Parasphingopyxis sp.]
MPIAGLKCRALTTHMDSRGELTEIFRESWQLGKIPPKQWNMVRSVPNVLRGVHLHGRHEDSLTVIEGELLLGLQDLRPDSDTHGTAILLTIDAGRPAIVGIPVGVAHGFYFRKPSIHVYGVDIAFDGTDEYGCQWNDEGLSIDWPCTDPILSERDQQAGTLDEMIDAAGFAE